MQFIDLKEQYGRYKEEIDAAIHRVLDHGKYIMGPEVKGLEEKLAAYVGVKHAITVSSGTDSLYIALMALGVGPGDEVITTPFSWISTGEVIQLCGATPVFVDIDPENYCIAVDKIEEAITPRTKAIMPVSLYGVMPDYDRINAIAAKHGLPVLEDAAQSFGATHGGRKSCGVTTIGSTSFFPAKPLGCYGDGGALFTDDDELAKKMRAIRVHGGEVRHQHNYLGMNGRFDTIQAAITLVKLAHYEEEVRLRQQVGERYSKRLSEVCATPTVPEGETHVYAQYTIRVPEREHVMAALKEAGIPAGIYYPKGMYEQPVFRWLGYSGEEFPETEKACQEVLSLPMHPWLSHEDQDQIIKVVQAARAALV